MNHDLCEGLWIDLDTMTLYLDPARLRPQATAGTLAFDIMPALEDAYCKYVVPDQGEESEPEERNGDAWELKLK